MDGDGKSAKEIIVSWIHMIAIRYDYDYTASYWIGPYIQNVTTFWLRLQFLTQ